MMEEFTVPENILKLSEERSGEVNVIRADWDHQGVYFYQAYSQQIADFALNNGNFGGDGWNPDRMQNVLDKAVTGLDVVQSRLRE